MTLPALIPTSSQVGPTEIEAEEFELGSLRWKIWELYILYIYNIYIYYVFSTNIVAGLNMDPFKMNFLLKMRIFHCHVSLPEGK